MTDRETAGRPNRRAFLGVVGAAALAGCSGLNLATEEERTVDGAALKKALAGSRPTVVKHLPVDIEPAYLDRVAKDVRDRLGSLPTPFDAEQVPNGAVRAELAEGVADAETALDEYEAADAPLDALTGLERAREAVGGVEAGWQAVDWDASLETVREWTDELGSDIGAFRERWRYVGDDPVPAVVAHAAVESRVASAGRHRRSAVPAWAETTALSVAEGGADVAAGRAELDDAGYLYDRFADSLDESRALGDTFRAAGETLADRLDSVTASLPPDGADPASYVEADVEDTVAAAALGELRDNLDYAHGLADERATGQRASAVLSLHRTLAQARAFTDFRARVEADQFVVVESATDVQKLRQSAVTTIRDAAKHGEHPLLDAQLLDDAAGAVEYASAHVAERTGDGEMALEWLRDDFAWLVYARELARATPETSAEVAAVLWEED